jgi:LemA protein
MISKSKNQKGNASKIILMGLGGVAILLLIFYVSIRNSFVTLSETIDASWAQVENQMKRRADLIPNLVNTVKGYASQEKEVFGRIADARAQMAGAKTVDQKVQASRQFESAISRLLVVVEKYPNLKSNEQFNRLMDELAGSENRLSVERMRFNENVKSYNQAIKLFPKNVVANFSGFQKREYFEIQEKDKQVPTVTF